MEQLSFFQVSAGEVCGATFYCDQATECKRGKTTSHDIFVSTEFGLLIFESISCESFRFNLLTLNCKYQIA